MDTPALDFALLPGLSVFGPGFGLPLALLWALLEEPFYSRAGARPYSIRYALRTNLVAYLWAWGCALPLFCLISGHGDNSGLFTLCAIWTTPVLIHAKYFYLLKHTPMRDNGLKWVIAGNAVSIATGVILFFSLPIIRAARPQWQYDLSNWQGPLYFASTVPAAIVFICACFSPLKKVDVAVANRNAP